MDGRERAVILTVLLVVVIGYVASLVVGYINGTLDFDSYKGEMAWATLFLSGLLVKLPPTVNEAKATAEAAANGTKVEEMTVESEQTTVTAPRS